MEVAPPQLTGLGINLPDAHEEPLCDQFIPRLEQLFELFVFVLLAHKLR